MSGMLKVGSRPSQGDRNMLLAMVLHPRRWSEPTAAYAHALSETQGALDALSVEECIDLLDDVEGHGKALLSIIRGAAIDNAVMESAARSSTRLRVCEAPPESAGRYHYQRGGRK